MHERLQTARSNAGFTKAAEATEQFGWAYSTYAGHENGSRGITRDAAAKYARAFGVSPEWILFGKDDAPTRVEHGEAVPDNAKMVPVYDVAASAGHGALVDYEATAYSLAFPPEYLSRLTSSAPKNLAIISVKGESMEPTLLDDDIVLLDASKTNLSYDGLFVLRFGDTLHVKRVGRSAKKDHVSIISDNRDLYPALEVSVGDVEAVGKVLWYGRKV